MNLNDNPKGGTFCLSKAGLAEGNSDATDIDIAAPNGAGVDFVINGVLYHKADAQDIVVNAQDEDGTTVSQQADDTKCIYLVQLNSSGTVSTVKGTEVDVDSDGDPLAGQPLRCPQPSADNCPIGYIKVLTDGTAWTIGTDDLDNGSITVTYVDLFAIPPEPIE